MLFSAYLRNGTTLLLCGLASLLVGAFVYATIDRTVVVTEQLLVIPGNVSTQSWQKVENTLVHDINEFSLYQDFNDVNAAYLDKNSLQPAVLTPLDSINEVEALNPVEQTPGDSTIESTTEASTTDSLVTPVLDDSGSEVEMPAIIFEPEPNESNNDADEDVVDEVPVIQEEPPVPEAAPETVTSVTGPVWGAFAYTDSTFPLLQAVELTAQTTTSEVDEELLIEDNFTVELVTEENIALPASEEVDVAVTTEEASTSDAGTEGVEATDDSQVVGSEVLPAEELALPTVENYCDDDSNCGTYSTTFSGFSLPEFETGTFLTGTQLRLSLAAQANKQSIDELQRFVVEYTYDDNWSVATIIDIEDEISNSINGGYFLVSLGQPPQHNQLASLQVRVSYQGNIENLERAYIEGLWLEVTSGVFYEETDPALINSENDLVRSLENPKFHELNGQNFDSGVNELPSFTLSYSPQQGFIKRALTSVFSENHYTVDTVRIIDNTGAVLTLPVEVVYHDDKTWTIRFLKQPQKIVPGKYVVELVVNENDTLFTDSFEFYWGVLAVNTTKSMYLPGENVNFNLAALTDRGDTICDATLELKVIDPNNEIHEIPVSESGFCGKNNVTDIPDYLAKFSATTLIGEYTVQLKHLNSAGEVVHKIQDHFEIREYVPYDIERSAPTRIYPPAPYTVTLDIKANRSFRGDIVERVPRGFVFAETSGAEVTTLAEATLLTWKNVVMEEGDSISLKYVFDAPDISPYMYLLGPLDMDGFREIRQWQIASDAISSVAWLTATQSQLGTNLNDSTPGALLWSTSTVDAFYFGHSTSTNPERLYIEKDGDYKIAVTLPLQRNDAVTNQRARVGFELRVNGSVVPQGLGRSGLIYNQNSTNFQNEGSSHGTFLLTNLVAGDYVEVYVQGLTNYFTQPILITGRASMYVEHIPAATGIFAATATSTISSANLNTATSSFSWTETRQDSGFVHSDTVTPQSITISNSGIYAVYINIPIESPAVNGNRNLVGEVTLDGVRVAGGLFSQGYHAATANNDLYASLHWSGVIQATTTNQVVTVNVAIDANTGTTTIPTGYLGSIMIQELPTSDVIALRGRDLSGGTDWNPAAPQTVLFDTQLAYDTAIFTHSTSSNSDDITVDTGGDYLLVYNDALTTTAATNNAIIDVMVNGVAVSGAQTKSHYISAGTNHNESSGSLVYNLEALSPGDVINIRTSRDAATTVMNDRADALLLVWKKKEFNFRPEAATMYNTPFDNIRFASTTPYFDFSTVDPDGSSDLMYEFELATTSDFVNATLRTSGTDAGFSNIASSTDTSPFVESNRIRFQLQGADALAGGTYYWRVRAQDVTGSEEYGDWSTTQSFTVDTNKEVADWYQTEDGQFLSNTLIGVASAEGGSAVVDIVENTEALLVYGEKTDTLIKYRLWDGSAWTSETNGPNINSEIYWAVSAAGNTRDEYSAVFLTADGDVNAMIYQASTSNWGNQSELVTDVNTPARRGIAVAYETISGDALAVSCSAAADPVYSIWNGTTWSATSTLNVASASNCNWLSIAADPMSDEIILVIRGAADTYEAHVWDGSAWGNAQTIGRVGALTTDGMSVMYEDSGDQAMVVSTDAGDNEFMYNTWNGTEWLPANVVVPVTSDFENGQLVRDEGTDRIGFCMVDDASDINVFMWDGETWGSETQLEPATESIVSRPFDCEFETAAGRDGNLAVVYSDAATDEFQYFDTAWSGPLNLTDMEEFWYVQTERTGDGTILAIGMENAGIDPLRSSFYNGSTWSANTLIESDPAETGVDPRSESFAVVAKRFNYAEGVLLTHPIDFTYVSGQPTWGDLSFNTTEPVGTSVVVRLKYSSTTACDAYIPNGTLSGNDTGFMASSSPIDLSSLSTSTYDQVCLEAVIERTGETSASLDDWNLTWVREPKLIQNAYRWYVNGSFLTPTDPWPSGVADIAETTPLSAVESISIDEIIRLRISLQALGIDLPAENKTFKLQFAEGLTCSPDLTWNDVAGVASTTAIWRGYENAIVGDDWYSASWGRRIKITVDETLVNEGLIDFPVYVNLADLPAGFFDNLQADGDDIRITEVDGVTELPFELVSINTTTEIGELHFKGDLASTTDTDFYIYYSNPSASGYSASATYGSQNVWTNSFEAVYHLDTNPASSMIDSSSNGQNLTAGVGSGMGSGNSTSSVMGNGIDFDGINDRLTSSGFTWTDVPVTVSAWNSVDTAEVKTSNLFGFTASGNERLATHAPWSDNTLYWDYGTCCASPGRVSTSYTSFRNKWTHVALTSKGSGGNFMGIYLDGTVRNSLATADDPNVTLTGFSLGSDNPSGGNHHNGRIDEFRLASAARSSGWISTEYNNQVNATGFYAVSSEELISDGRGLPSTVLTPSDNPESYEEYNPTSINQNQLVVGDDSEWDFVLQNNNGTANTNYCFRMIYENGAVLNTYNNYPRLITNSPPLVPELIAPFDNEQTASTTPWFEFAADDELSDLVSYVVEIDTDYDFSSPVITRESNANFSQFTNLSNPSERGIYTAGQIIQFIPNTTLTNGNTYWWRVKASDDEGSGAYGEWSTPSSFTIDTGTVITTWFQTTQEQFDTDNLQDAISNVADDVRINTSLTIGTTTSTAIEYADVDTGNAWGELQFTDNETSGDIKYAIEYLVSGNEWSLVPDADLSGNSAGFDTSPINLANLSTTIYHTIRIRAVMTGNDSLPRLQNWSLLWGQRIEPPTLINPFDNAKVDDTTPNLSFVTTDPQADALLYELQISSDSDFVSSSTYISGTDSGFTNLDTPLDTPDYNSGDTIQYTVQSALTDGNTYWWRVRARDPGGDDAYSDWSTPESFTIDTALVVSTWYQTTGDQFATNGLTDIETLTGSAQITTTITEAMVAYGESTSLNPRYRIWNGTEWSDASSAGGTGALIEWAELKAAPLRSEYALATLGTDGDVNVQIYDANTSTWGDMFELETEISNTNLRGVDIAYETDSGDLLAVTCSGTDANYAIWNGTAWSATSSIALANTNACRYIKLASDPTSDEIMAVFRHENTSNPDYEAYVWSGSSWGNASAFGNMADNANEGISVEYEESGNQAVVVVSNDGNASFLYDSWNGSSWSGALTFAMQDDYEHGVLKRDVGTDRLALCNVDQDGQVSNVFWNGAAWGIRDLLEVTSNGATGRPVSCEFETTSSRDGYLMVPYSDATDARYQFYATSTYSGELTIASILGAQGAWTTQTIRTDDGLIFALFLQDAGNAPADRYEFAYWNGSSWLGQQTLSSLPSVSGTPFHESISMAAQIYPNFNSGNILSTPIEFTDGDGPRWQQVVWDDTTPGASSIKYRVYYETSPDTFALVPDSALTGNAAGFTTSPLDISSLDTSIYNTLKLDAELLCSAGDCPTLNEWSVEWSEGITISGTALAYDQLTALASGTVAVAINGVIQSGKTANIASGFAVSSQVFSSAGTSTFTVPAGVNQVTIKTWGAGGGGGAGGEADLGGVGGGGGYVEGTFSVTPAENLTVNIGAAGSGGTTGSPAGGGGGGGYSSVYRTSTPLTIAGAGGGGAGGAGGISYVGVGTSCAVSGASCSPTIPGSTAQDDVLIAVLHSRTDTAHTCTANCTGWTEFSTQIGTNGRLSVWYLRRGGSAPGTPTFAGPVADSYTGRIWAFRGVATTGNPYDVVSANTTQAAASPYVGSSITSTETNVMSVFAGGSLDDNTWGPGGGVCTIPSGVDANFYAANTNGTDNSIFLCYNDEPTNTAGPLSVPSMAQVANATDAGRWFTFALRPAEVTLSAAGTGGTGGGTSGGTGGPSGTATGGAGGTQVGGGASGGGAATAGSSLAGGVGGTGTAGGAGGSGGTIGGGAGGRGNAATAEAGGGGGGAGYFGGGGGEEADLSTVSGAGGGGGSSYVATSSTATTTTSASGATPGNSGDSDYASGAAIGGTGGATTTNGGVGGVGRVVVSWLATTTTGTWSISNVNVSAGDVVTVFIEGASSTGKAVGYTKYDGTGDIANMELIERHLTIGSSDNATTTNADLAMYDSGDDSDLFHSVAIGNILTLCSLGSCGDSRLRIKSGSIYQPGASGTVVNFQNYGTFLPGANTLRVSNAWQQYGTFTPDTSTVIFTATTSTLTLEEATSTFRFNNVTFGETSGSAIWNITKPLDIDGSLAINYGTLARATSTINIGGNLSLGSSGFVSGLATTTFDGSGSNTWSDAKASASSTNVGYLVVDGTAKTITLAGNVGAESVTVAADDTLNASGSGYNINVVRNWTNLNSFIPQTGTVTFIGTTTGTIARGTSAFNNLTFSGVGGVWSFSTSTLALNGNFTIATGTVTLPTGTTTIAGSFLNTGGVFAHNNGEVRMTSTAAGRSITQSGTAFLNPFYDLVFSGSGAWSFTEANATTSRNFRIQAGTVTLPSGQLTIGGDYSVTLTGAFTHNSGEVVLLVQDSDDVRANGSSFNNLRTVGGSGSWYNTSWNFRKSLIVNSSQVVANVTDFPVYVNLNSLGSDFFTAVKSDGSDIRVTTNDGLTEVPFEIVSISTGGLSGELHFKAPSLSSTTNSTFYVYYGNSAATAYASTSAFGSRNVWTSSYEAVYHLNTDPASTVFDSTSNGRNLTSAGSMNSSDVVAGAVGNSIDFDGTDDRLSNAAFAWQNASNTVTITAWNNVTTAETKNANLFGFTESGGQRLATHGPWGDAVIYWDFGAAGTPGRVSTSYASYRNKWTHIGMISQGAGSTTMAIYLDGVVAVSGSPSDPSATLTGFSLGSLGAAQYHDGRIDEFRIASVARAAGWIGTEENNQSSTTAFYSVSGAESRFVRSFTDTNATILGNFNLNTGGDSVFPTGILSIGGSFDNNANFTATSGTVRFNSTAGAETVAVGSSTFATVEFNSATGDFTVTENATATVAFNLTSASQFTLQSGLIFAATGSFTNAALASSTTWTGSTLRLSGSDSSINIKTHGGDTYATLETVGDTDIAMWNSNATSFVTASTSSIYSQDHAGVDGDLYIYGNYIRSTGTEYWSYARDFDGTALTASTSRQVDVRVATSSTVGFTGASLNLVGSTAASTTIGSQAGVFSLNATNTTITAEYFTVSGTDSSGFGLRSSSTLSTFKDALFNVAPSSSGITIDASTVATNPSAQLFRVGFATSSLGSASNVTLSGTTGSFVWFREGFGNLYGEAFDNADANPGSIRFDDSSNSIVVSGIVYADDGVTPLGAPTCDGVTTNVRVVVNGGSYSSSTSCAVGTGAYSFGAVNYIGDPRVVVYLNTNGGVKGSVVTKTPSGNITNMNIYANRVITRHEDVSALTASDMTSYDNSDDTDLSFIAATTSLQLLANTELFVYASTTFAPGGNITLLGNGNSNNYEGTLQLGASATFTASGTETHTLAGRLVLATTSTLTTASSTFIFNATTTGKSITSPNTITFNELAFNGSGGGWNITAPIAVINNMDIFAGTVTGTGDINLQYGSLSGNGILSLGSGTTTLQRSNTLGGTSNWTFYNLNLGNGTVVGTTTPGTTGTTTILSRLTIANAHFLAAGFAIFDLAGSGTVFTETGTLLEATSTFRFSGSNANIPGTTFYDLILSAGAGSSTYTGIGSGLSILNDLVVGGVASTTANFTTNDPTLTIGNNLTIASQGTFVGSNSATFNILGSFDNNGTYVGSGGTVNFTGTGSETIAAGSSSFSSVRINGSGSFAVTENATATAAWLLSNHANFTVNSGVTLAVGSQFTNSLGGAATTFTGSTLHLFGGGSQSINSSTTNDIYENISVALNTRVRMWNSSASSYSVLGGLYSQDHAATNGLLNIYGVFTENSVNDHWSYATDFDGTSLLGGNERAVTVAIASGGVATWTGGSLSVLGSSTATTSITNQGSGTYDLAIGGSATTNWEYASVRNITSQGVVLSGTPIVTNFSRTDHLVQINSGTAMTVGGTVINTNEALSFTGNIFEADLGVTGAVNVTATGTAVSSWRFTNHSGDIAGEAFDNDPTGDPGYLTWDDSAALISISGTVYSDEGVTLSSVCDGVTSNIRLVVANTLTDTNYDTTCDASTRNYTINSIAYSPLDTIVVYIIGETEKAANVTVAPISSIGNMHLYENRVIVRHENTNPLTIADMSVWDSSDDADIPYTAVDGAPDTLTIPANRKLLIWTGKTFAPGGNVTLSGGGAGADYDGTLEAQSNARFRSSGTEVHSIGGSFIFGSNADYVTGLSTTTFTTTGTNRTIDVNEASFYNVSFTGSGSWSVADANSTVGGNLAQSAGTLTLSSGTTTVVRSLNATGGVINTSAVLSFISTTTGNIIKLDDSVANNLYFNGTGGAWSMTDINATATRSVVISRGTVTFPSGNFAIGGNMLNNGGTITHNTSDLIFTATSTALILASSSDLYGVRFAGPGPFTLSDVSLSVRDNLTIASGTVTVGTGTLSVGGSFDGTGGVFNHSSGTVLFNASALSKTINPGNNNFYNVQFSAPAGGYTLSTATTTNNFTLSSASSFTLQSGATLFVGGVFSNSVGGAATTFTGSTIDLVSGGNYSINSRTTTGDTYGTLSVGAATDIRIWNSSAATTSVNASGSLYSQDHANNNGDLYIFGDFNIGTTTEYWSYATDFDGTSLTGVERAARVYLAANASTTLSGGSLQIQGGVSSSTVIQNQSTGTYNFLVSGGTLNATYYSFSDLSLPGMQLSSEPTITDLSNGYFELALNTGTLITLSSTTLNANASKIFTNVGFATSTGVAGYNVNLVGETTNAWRFSGSYGSIGGEGFDVDGIDACGAIRFDDSACLLTEQTHFRWRNDDGGEGAPNSEWFDTDWNFRKRVRFDNGVAQTYATTAVKMTVAYDSDMQANFSDLRFTDEDGQTELSHWTEKITASTEAIVWVEVPSLVASDNTTVFMYYGNALASSSSSGTSTFPVFDDYEDNSISEYTGDTGLFQVDTTPVYGGTYALEAANKSGRTTDGIYRFDQTVSQGQRLRWMQYVSTSGDEACTIFGVQSPGTTNDNYAVCLERFGTNRIVLSRDVSDNDVSGTVLASTTVTYATGWYEVEVDWRTDNSIYVYLYNSAGSLVASIQTTDGTYTSGGFGYTFWFQNGSWDSFTARNRVTTAPTVYFGVEQTDGGATFDSNLDAAGNALPGDLKRLRIAVENSGLDITAQEFELEYALKDTAPSCESVSSLDYVVVPNQASCGSSPVCMSTSSNVTNADVTTDLLFGTNGTFTPGEIVASPNSSTGLLDVDQNYYTELEYVITPTINATDALCLRVTNGGTPLDFYASVAELALQFDPSLSPVTLNDGSAISLIAGTTTAVIVNSTSTDFNGYNDLTYATATVYRSGAGASCTPNNNDCYVLTTEAGTCSFTNCSGSSCRLVCAADIIFHADPTDFGTYSGQEWLAYLEVEDAANGYDFDSAIGVELNTLRALEVDALIDYGSLAADSDTGTFNPTTTITNLGNIPINVDVEATDLTDGISSLIPAEQQKVSTSTFTYTACVSCFQLSSSSAVTLGINLSKPSVVTPPVESDVYWGIAIPLGVNSAPHSGVNVFTPIDI